MKIRQIQNVMQQKKVELFLIMNLSEDKKDPNMRYFTGIMPEFGIMAIPKNGAGVLYVPLFEAERMKKMSTAKIKPINKKKLLEQIKHDFKAKKIGLNYDYVAINDFKRLKKALKAKYFDFSKVICDLRIRKNKDEIKIIKKSCLIASKILDKCIKQFGSFKTEGKVKEFLLNEAKLRGCELAFDTIVASGNGAAQPHYSANKRLTKGFCVIDFGVRYKGYCSDITRTVYIGKPSEDEIQKYDLVLETQKKCAEMIKEKVKTAKVYEFAQKQLGKYFTHGLGHGIGVQIHELPNLSPKSKERFEKGMIFTIEP